MIKNQSNLIISGDDYGLTEGITNNLLASYDHGVLSSVSIIPNGYAFDYAINEKKKRPSLRLAIHLNLIEGKPLSSPETIPLLVDSNGLLNNSFLSLWCNYFFANYDKKKQLEEQITQEFNLQINRVKENFDFDFHLNIDSHQHIHLVPFISKILINLHSEFNFSYIRIPYEPSFLFFQKISSLKYYFRLNLIKHLLLNFISYSWLSSFQNINCEYPRFFIGVLFTGRMSNEVVNIALTRIKNKIMDVKTVEVLFHPGEADFGEEPYWKNYDHLKRYYYSPDRMKERMELKSNSLNETIKKYLTF